MADRVALRMLIRLGEIVSAQNITIREYMHLDADLKRLVPYCRASSESMTGTFAARYALLPLLVYLRQFDSDSFERITRGEDPDLAWKIGSKYRGFREIVATAMGKLPNTGAPTSEEQEEVDARYVRNLCIGIYDIDSRTREKARREVDLIGNIDPHVYKYLRFPDAI